MRLSTSCAAVAIVGLALTAGAARPVALADESEKVTVIGCAVKGEDGDGFLLANTVEARSETTAIARGDDGTSVTTSNTTALGPSRILYWLDDDDDVMENLMGHQVEVVGEAEGDLEIGEVEIEREGDAIEVEIEADGRKARVSLPNVPSAVGTSGSVSDDEQEIEYVVRKLDVKSARMIAPTCQ